MTSETLAKSLETERKSGQGTAITIILIVLIVFGVYWFAVRASAQQEEPEKQTDPDEDGYHPTEEDYEYMDDDDFDEEDLDDEDYDLLEEGEDLDDDADSEAEDDVRISDILNETHMWDSVL